MLCLKHSQPETVVTNSHSIKMAGMYGFVHWLISAGFELSGSIHSEWIFPVSVLTFMNLCWTVFKIIIHKIVFHGLCPSLTISGFNRVADQTVGKSPGWLFTEFTLFGRGPVVCVCMRTCLCVIVYKRNLWIIAWFIILKWCTESLSFQIRSI